MKWHEQPWSPIPNEHVRTPGLHLGQLVREYERDVLGDVARPAPGAADNSRSAFFEGGFIFEEMCGALLRRSRNGKRMIVQREVERDGVLMTPDFVDPIDELVVDSKLTWKSTSNIEKIEAGKLTWDKLWPGYLMQLMSYTHYYEFNRGALIVFFAMGNWLRGAEWSGPVGPRVFVFEWKTSELERNWAMVLRYRDQWLKRGGPKPYSVASKSMVGDDVEAFTF